MPRPVTISDEDILEAARALFTAKGPQATTSEIARKAGVSEGILFKRYGSKAGLLKAAMSSGTVNSWIENEMPSRGPLRTQKDFVRLIRRHLEVLREVVPIVVMAWSSRSMTDELPAESGNARPAPLVAIKSLAAMLQSEMDLGHLARRDPEATARILIGSVWYFVFLGVSVERANRGFSEATFVEQLARMIYADLALPAGKRARARRR